ncbi:V-type proton ATPase 116 kDa subunit A isoform 1-like protein [Piromyces finnis]|uniref:V-type proton ATPase subunit a n=1 Tax=Piromyces finnis TaxID=1754191 RepID=A0A1Y1V0L2_9FUNG|nr:V-type proton ATPase 116 kDa subunit A isoform 1-like protein [Piromyces finnis]|eukprot:ORX44679.1 V-type proton ATPase 116 kDa subunit A isoform 1-like protein [Piromyces finnis]
MTSKENEHKEDLESSFLRSEVMSYVQFYIPNEIAKHVVSEIGEIGLVQFVDLNRNLSAFQKVYVQEIRKCDEIERELRFFRSQIKNENLPPIKRDINHNPKFTGNETIDTLKEKIKQHEIKLIESNANQNNMNKSYVQLIQLKNVLEKVDEYLTDSNYKGDSQKSDENQIEIPDSTLLEHTPNSTKNFRLIAGVIERNKVYSFQKIVWRALRGNLLFHHIEVEEPNIEKSTDDGEPIYEDVFIIMVHGAELVNKIKRICDAFNAVIYDVPDDKDTRNKNMQDVNSRLSDIKKVLDQTRRTRVDQLSEIQKDLNDWSILVRKEKSVYGQMNLFKNEQQSLIAEGWVPTNKIDEIRSTISRAMEERKMPTSVVINEKETVRLKPTYNITNKFTKCFQSIVDSYGIASYREINPALYTIITFPFLFAIMFGDIGHGILMFLAALVICIKEKQLALIDNEIFSMLFSGRYVVLLMGAFSIYTGFVYNEMFAKPLSLFSTKNWVWENQGTPDEEGFINQSGDLSQFKNAYPFGMDPAWLDAENKLIFMNSYKMKMSVVIGVIHMIFGTILSVFNFAHFRSAINIVGVFIPELIFMISIFGYLAFTIVYKWCTDWTGGNPPSLLNMLINMFLSPGNVEEDEQLYSGQATIQLILVLLAVICIPWLLLYKPFALKMKHKNDKPLEINEDIEEEYAPKEFNFSDEFINRAVGTIEYCLSGISHTASYLRLWALSLAHGQLSEVLWNMLLDMAFNFENPVVRTIAIFAIFAAWFTLTVAILLLMEGLSAFLHALRLHWVEFNSKFFAGVGYKFTPFSFRKIIKRLREESKTN